MRGELDGSREVLSLPISEQISLPNGSTISVAGIKHAPDYFDAHRSEFEMLISNATYIAIEADPSIIATPKMRKSHSDDSFYSFYGSLVEIALKNGKPVFFSDPDRSSTNFLGLFDIFSSSLAVVTGAILEMVAISEVISNVNNRNLSRRGFLKFLGKSAGAVALEGYAASTSVGDEINGDLLQRNSTEYAPERLPVNFVGFRNAGTVVGIQKAASLNLVKGNGMLFIGEAHRPGIVNGLQRSPQENENRFHDTLGYLACKVMSAQVSAQVYMPQGDALLLSKQVELI